MAEKDPLRERIEELGRMNTSDTERPWHDWKPGAPSKRDHFTHDVPRAIDDEHPPRQAGTRSARLPELRDTPPRVPVQ